MRVFLIFNNFLMCFDMSYLQCDLIGWFLKALGNKYSFKSGPNVWRLFGLFKKHHFLSKHCFGYFLTNLWWKFGYFLVQNLVHCLILNFQLLRFIYTTTKTWRFCISIGHFISNEIFFRFIKPASLMQKCHVFIIV